MGLQKVAFNFMVERGGKLAKSLLCSKPQKAITNIKELKYNHLVTDTVQIAKKEVTALSDCIHISNQNKHWSSLVDDLNSYIKPEKFLGRGAEARVYKLNKNYVLRLSRGQTTVDNQHFIPVQDIFDGRNYGQAVAISENGKISINKFVPGNMMYKAGDYNPITYLGELRKYSKLPDETLEKFIEDVSYINKKGYRIDSYNPENFLYDSTTQRIGIIDIKKKGTSTLDLYNPYGHDWILSALCNEHDLLTIMSQMNAAQKKEVIDLITELEARIIPMCKKYNIPLAKYNSKDYSRFSMAEFLSLRSKINVSSNEGIRTQIIKLNHPDMIEYLKNVGSDY